MEESQVQERPETVSIEEHQAALSEANGKIANLEQAQNLIGSDGNFKEGWLSSVAPDLEGSGIEAKFKSLSGFIKSYDSMERMKGKSHIPDDSWDESQVSEFYEKLGVPSDLEAYAVPEKIESLPDGMERVSELESGFMKFAHEHRMKPADAQAALEWYYSQQGSQIEQMQANAQEQQDALTVQLQEDIGVKGLTMARKAAQHLSDKLGLDLINDPSVASNPNIIKILNHVGANLLGEQNLPKLDEEITVTDASSEIQDIMSNPNNPYYRGYRQEGTVAQNQRAQSHMERLFNIKHR